jgi:hypothetical protein
MPRNLYADVDAWERRFSQDIDLATSDRRELEAMIETASRDVDRFCRRFFYAETKALTFDGNGKDSLVVPDLLVVASIKLDENVDRAYETTLAATDFYLMRPDHERPYDTMPKTLIVLDTRNGNFSVFQRSEKLLLIDAEWGYGNDTEDTGATVQDAVEQGVSQATLLVPDGASFSVGQTLLLDTEQEYVTGVAGDTLSIARGVNGTTPATHTNGLQIDRYVYPPLVRDATHIQAVRLFKRKEVGFIDREPPSRFGEFDEGAGRLLQDFVRYDL